jgi:hypothetical protein
MSAVGVLVKHLANTHGSSADSIDWKKWYVLCK